MCASANVNVKNRVYKTLKSNEPWKRKIPAMLISGKPVYFLSIETTGLDRQNDRIIGIVIAKTVIEDNLFVTKDILHLLVNPECEIPPQITKINKISNEMVKDAPTIAEAFAQVNDYIGEKANIVAFNTAEFVGPFLDAEMQRSGVKLSIGLCVDLYSMALGLIGKKKKIDRMSMGELVKRCGIKSSGIQQKVDLFNIMYQDIPLGYEKAKVRRTNYWEKSYTVRYIYIETDYGKVRLNCVTGYFEEDTPGIFDVIDLDYLTEYICERRNVASIYDFIKLYDKTKR